MGMPWHKTPNDMSVNFRFFGLNVVNQRHYLFLLMAKGRGVLDQDFNDADAAFAEQALNGLVANALNISRPRAVKLKQALLLAGLIDEHWQPLDWDALHSERASYKEIAGKTASSGQAMTSTERSRKSRANKKTAATDVQRERNECNDDAAVCSGCNDDATTCNESAAFVQRNDRCMTSKNSFKNQIVSNATLDRDLDVDLDVEKERDLKAYAPASERSHGSADAPPVEFSREPSPAPVQTQTAQENNENLLIDAVRSNLRNLTDNSLSATSASENDLNRLKSQNNPLRKPFNQQVLTAKAIETPTGTVFQENTHASKQTILLTSPLLAEVQETLKAAANAALPPSSGAPPKTKPASKKINDAQKPDNVEQGVWDDFLKLRKAKKAPLSNTALNQIKNEAEKARMPLNDVLALCCLRGWQGFKAQWVENEARSASPSTLTSPLLKESSGGAGCPVEDIVQRFNALLPELPSVELLTEKRKKMLAERWHEFEACQSLEFWEYLFDSIKHSDFLMGRSEHSRDWRLTFDWLIEPNNFAKVAEGHYLPRTAS